LTFWTAIALWLCNAFNSLLVTSIRYWKYTTAAANAPIVHH
jgi:hypothetical protein